MKINEQNSPARTQPISLTDESMFDLEELTNEEMVSIVGGSDTDFGFGADFNPDAEENEYLSSRARLNFDTSFTGESRVRLNFNNSFTGD